MATFIPTQAQNLKSAHRAAASPNRILHVPRRSVAEEWGGVETVVLELSRQQQQHGLHPEIVTSMALATSRRDQIEGVPVLRFPYFYPYFGLTESARMALDKKGGNLVSWSLLYYLFRAQGVRLFHAHALKRLGAEVRTAARWRKLPYLVTLHGGFFDVPQEELKQLTQAAGKGYEWGKAIGAVLGSRRLLEDADLVVCIGRSEYEKARVAISHDRIALLGNGVNPDRFATGNGARFRQAQGIGPDEFLIMSISRIDAQKNQAQLIEAFAEIHRKLPRTRLVLLGPVTQPAYADRLRERIQELGLAGAALLLPAISHQDPALSDAYHACDLFVLPSMHEPFGIVVLEAWSCHKPVVVSRIGGLCDLVREGENGLFFDPNAAGGTHQLAACMETLALQSELGRRLGQLGHQEVLSRYAWTRVSEQMEQLYQRAEATAARRYSS